MENWISTHWPKALPYADYRQLIEDLLAQGLTTGPQQSEDLTAYARLNEQRMKRLDKTLSLSPEAKAFLAGLKRSYRWVVLAEGWCGDAAQNLPLFHAMAQASERIEMRILLRDEHLEVMDRFLTGTSRSIPKLIALDAESGELLGTWGPRPAPLQAIVDEFRSRQVPYKEYSEDVHRWYAHDKTQAAQQELLALLEAWEAQPTLA
jgi:hypothetical protein